MDNKQEIPFSLSFYAMKILGKNLYSNPWTAVSEIVANGIDAGATNVYVLIDMRDKEKAVVEIFDNGSGMSYRDLTEKYTLIGRNRRLEQDERKGKTLGRKGIGKLAALYLSPRYYLFTKNKDEQSVWVLNTQDYSDSDRPALIPVRDDSEKLIAQKEWDQIKTGTMIHLADVDLRKIGPERIKSLRTILADYYLENVISAQIKVCVLNTDEDSICFNKITKNICFNTMFGIFDNTGLEYKNKLKPKVYLTKANVDPRVDYPRETVVLDETKYNSTGMMTMTNLKGENVEIPYEMKGWIGIHTSLDQAIIERDAPTWKKVQNHPNALRLYVRGKLAVNNLMNYVASTAAFASYIEGEISFDVLDDDMFEDASTSSREGYSINDPRIRKLIEIVSKIISTLVVERNKVGNTINEELRKIQVEIEEEAKREKEKRQEAEHKATLLQQQNNTLFNAISEKQETFSAKTHLIKTNAIAIRNSVCTLAQKVGITRYKEVGAIAISTDKIISSLKYSALAKFNIEDEYIEADLFVFCSEYINTVLSKQYFHISFEIQRAGSCEMRFNPQYVSLILDNLVSNSEKSHSTKFVVKMSRQNEYSLIEVRDNGDGFGNSDLDRIFEFGVSNTGGTGIGLYNIKRAIEKMKGTIKASKNEMGGATFLMQL